ncbi:hypothetical protein L5515_019257 [Caenorhabditis briggsae]|uniref:Uncharacterized protein n=1 Tax=Caenorhabditis briggsae TaxID=6238 RepID=A0AAE9FDU6_CAEBR|nr:hypothetical protein L5515_019257 [Caenorhabditis briggsae]
MSSQIARINKKNNVTETLLKTLVRKLERKNAHQGKIITFQTDPRVVAIKTEVVNENEEDIRPLTTKTTSYVYKENNGPVPQSVKKASAAHFYYRGHLSKREKYTRWSELKMAEKTKWTKEWTN